MILVVIIPSFIWVALLLFTWMTLANQAVRQLGVRHAVMMGMLAVMAIHALAASSAAIGTDIRRIDSYPCLMGGYGVWVSVGIVAIEIGVLLYLSRLWPRNDAGGMLRFRRWVSTWLAFNLIALLAFMRSSALCSV